MTRPNSVWWNCSAGWYRSCRASRTCPISRCSSWTAIRTTAKLDCLFDETVPRDLIAEQWDQMVRVSLSLNNRVAPPEIVVERLANVAPADRLAKALTAPRANHQGDLQKIVDQLRNSGQTVRDEDLARIWPLLHAHILPNGIYDFAGPEGQLTRRSALRSMLT